MANNQNDLNKRIKNYDKAIWILIGIIFVSLIAVLIIAFISPIAIIVPFVIIIASFIITFILIKIRIPIVKKAKQEHIQEIKDSKIMESLLLVEEAFYMD